MDMISLGRNMNECCPKSEIDYNETPKEVHYPTLYIDADGLDLGDLPMEGMAMVKYKIVRDSKTVENRKGVKTKRRSVEMEIHEIGPAHDSKEEDELDKLRDEVIGD